jgi:hypothetical protein
MALRLLAWVALAAALVVPVAIAATSPFLEWRDPVYIVAGLAGVVSLAILLLQPLLAGGYLPGVGLKEGRRWHAAVGVVLVAAVVVHVGGLWLTSPPDVIDALLLRSPTPFSGWGVLAMWAVFAAAAVAALRRPLRLRPAVWRVLHTALAALVVVGTVCHAMLIEGTMGPVSKAALCALVVAVAAWAIVDLRSWAGLARRKA